MKTRHAAALALVGCYLMIPPTLEMIDPACQSRRTSLAGSLKPLLRGSDENIVRCDSESLTLYDTAPLFQWDQAGTYETLAACKADSQKPLSDNEKHAAEAVSTSAMRDDQHTRPDAARQTAQGLRCSSQYGFTRPPLIYRGASRAMIPVSRESSPNGRGPSILNAVDK